MGIVGIISPLRQRRVTRAYDPALAPQIPQHAIFAHGASRDPHRNLLGRQAAVRLEIWRRDARLVIFILQCFQDGGASCLDFDPLAGGAYPLTGTDTPTARHDPLRSLAEVVGLFGSGTAH